MGCRLSKGLLVVYLVTTYLMARGNTNKGSISGLVLDSIGNPVPGATVVAMNTETGAESLSRGSALIDYLSNLAANAAQEWQFFPAHRGDKAVESETVLQFDFESNGSAGGSS